MVNGLCNVFHFIRNSENIAKLEKKNKLRTAEKRHIMAQQSVK